MAFRWLANTLFLLFPIIVTVSVLVGIEVDRKASGQPPIFAPEPLPPSGPSGPGGITPDDNRISNQLYCEQEVGITPVSKGLNYTLNPNQWGWNVGDPGALCMNITTLHNGSYATAFTAPEFYATWQYPQGPVSEPVHAFPNVQPNNPSMPCTLQSLKTLNFEVEWTYGAGNDKASTTDETALDGISVNANVAIDMFLDTDLTNSQNTTKAKFEVMVWFAKFGTSTDPIGFADGIISNTTINGTTFSLYNGENGQGQAISTWISSETTGSFTGDIAPLLSGLASLSSTKYPGSGDYLGYLSFGSEAFYADSNTTFYVPHLAVDLEAPSS